MAIENPTSYTSKFPSYELASLEPSTSATRINVASLSLCTSATHSVSMLGQFLMKAVTAGFVMPLLSCRLRCLSAREVRFLRPSPVSCFSLMRNNSSVFLTILAKDAIPLSINETRREGGER